MMYDFAQKDSHRRNLPRRLITAQRGFADFQNGDIVQLLYTETRRKQVSKNGRGKALRLQHPTEQGLRAFKRLRAAKGAKPERESEDKTKCKLAEARDEQGG